MSDDLYPSGVAELIEIIGEDAVIALAEVFGGTRLHVPKKIREGHGIERAIGRDAANALSAHYSPISIRIPVLREQRANALRASGFSNAKIATRLGMTETGVSRIFARLAAAGRLADRGEAPTETDRPQAGDNPGVPLATDLADALEKQENATKFIAAQGQVAQAIEQLGKAAVAFVQLMGR